MPEKHNNSKKVALISPPWPLYNRPSIQLGALKAFLLSAHPDLRVDARHFYLDFARTIGYKLYQTISERTWIAESIYAALLYPERFETAEKLFYREIRSKPILKKTGFKSITVQAKKITAAFVDSLQWEDYLLAGFSISLCQLTSGLYIIQRIKDRFPELFIIIGGSTFSGTVTGRFFELFPEVDAVINGEGELPLSQLICHLKASLNTTQWPSVNVVITPQSA